MGQDAVFCTVDVRDLDIGDRIGPASAEMLCDVDATASRPGKVAERLSIFALRGVEDDWEVCDGEGEYRVVVLFSNWSKP